MIKIDVKKRVVFIVLMLFNKLFESNFNKKFL